MEKEVYKYFQDINFDQLVKNIYLNKITKKIYEYIFKNPYIGFDKKDMIFWEN